VDVAHGVRDGNAVLRPERERCERSNDEGVARGVRRVVASISERNGTRAPVCSSRRAMGLAGVTEPAVCVSFARKAGSMSTPKCTRMGADVGAPSARLNGVMSMGATPGGTGSIPAGSAIRSPVGLVGSATVRKSLG
jgi:hypothetical protein